MSISETYVCQKCSAFIAHGPKSIANMHDDMRHHAKYGCPPNPKKKAPERTFPPTPADLILWYSKAVLVTSKGDPSPRTLALPAAL